MRNSNHEVVLADYFNDHKVSFHDETIRFEIEWISPVTLSRVARNQRYFNPASIEADGIVLRYFIIELSDETRMKHDGPIKVIVWAAIGCHADKINMPSETSDNPTIYPVVITAIIAV